MYLNAKEIVKPPDLSTQTPDQAYEVVDLLIGAFYNNVIHNTSINIEIILMKIEQ
jgi:hypothetical protein